MKPQEITVDSWLKHNAYADAAVYFDTEENKFCAQVYIDGAGEILDALGDSALEAIQNFEAKHRIK